MIKPRCSREETLATIPARKEGRGEVTDRFSKRGYCDKIKEREEITDHEDLIDSCEEVLAKRSRMVKT